MERESLEQKRSAQIKELNAARDKLTWDNFASVPVDKEANLRKVYHLFISACKSVRQYDNADINEVALIVYNATLNQDQRAAAEMIVGSKLHNQWYKLNEYCMDLKKYFKVAKSARKDVITTLDDVFGHDLPIMLDFSSSIESETESISPMQGTEPCDVSETSIPDNNTIYDADWLYVKYS